MKPEEAKPLVNKIIFCVLKSGYRYNGKVLEVFDDTLLLLDKFNSKVSLNLEDISILELKGGDGNGQEI